MKKTLLLITVLVYSLNIYPQNGPLVSKAHKASIIDVNKKIPDDLINPVHIVSSLFDPEEDTLGINYYEVQSWGSSQNRVYCYPDGAIGATWTFGFDWPNFASDRGTGYNYFDGTDWGSWPEERIETDRTGWPSYAPFGDNGELVVSFISYSPTSEEGLLFSQRINKGVGEWEGSMFFGPDGHKDLLWHRMVTGGENNNSIYLFAQVRPLLNGGSLYQGLDGALLYSKSTDGGETWGILNQLLPGMGSSEYTGFTSDCYSFAEPKDNSLAFVAGSWQHDLFLMKSDDGGETFEKTIIWDHPYDLLEPGFQTDTFYCVDGSVDVALDMNSNAHVVFGIVKTYFDIDDEKWRFFKMTDGVGYWNENMGSFSSGKNALNPTGHPDSELVKDESLIGYAQDLDGDSVITYLDDPDTWHIYYRSLGLSSMVQIVADDQGQLFLLFSSVTETFHDGAMNYRRLWLRPSVDNGESWGPFYHYFPNGESQFKECIYPSLSPVVGGDVCFVFQSDLTPGWHNDEEPYPQNQLHFVSIPKNEITDIKQSMGTVSQFDVSQNFPNPFSKTTTINVNIGIPAELSLKVISLMGLKVYETTKVKAWPGTNTLKIDRGHLSPGIYFYTVTVGVEAVTKKMIVE
ncbi:MAG: hypothetical protein DRJ05_12560 [Bacteroidetes bacterium]|nr:MAG: hypothetical protein DRJ05_12560 [Bacteroidota bacterium]